MVSKMTVTELRCAIELRADESRQSPGRIVGTLMQYETRAGDRPEMFGAGALSWDGGGIVLNEQHNRQAPIMRFKPEARRRQGRDRRRLAGHGPRARRGHDDPKRNLPRLERRLQGRQRGTPRRGVRLIRQATLAAAAAGRFGAGVPRAAP